MGAAGDGDVAGGEEAPMAPEADEAVAAPPPAWDEELPDDEVAGDEVAGDEVSAAMRGHSGDVCVSTETATDWMGAICAVTTDGASQAKLHTAW